jgi:hypothetical protein
MESETMLLLALASDLLRGLGLVGLIPRRDMPLKKLEPKSAKKRGATCGGSRWLMGFLKGVMAGG